MRRDRELGLLDCAELEELFSGGRCVKERFTSRGMGFEREGKGLTVSRACRRSASSRSQSSTCLVSSKVAHLILDADDSPSGSLGNLPFFSSSASWAATAAASLSRNLRLRAKIVLRALTSSTQRRNSLTRRGVSVGFQSS